MHSVLTRNQDINDPEYFKCCCGCHVKQGAVAIAFISMIAGFLRLYFGTVDSYNHTINYNHVISGMVVIVACSLVIYADVKEKAWAYIPFLVVQALGIIGYLVFIVLLLVLGITLPQWLIDALTQQGFLTHDQIRVACFIAIVILFVVEVLAIWFWTIVFRAYRYMSGVLRGSLLVDNYA